MPPQGLVPAVKNKINNLPLGNPNESDYDSDINFSGLTDQFTVTSGQMLQTIGAGFYQMATAGNLVWEDANNNGIQDNEEPRVENVKVEAFNDQNEKIGEDFTNADGVYLIEYLGKDQYYLKFTPPSGYGFTIANTGGELIDSDVDHSNGTNTTSLYSMEPGENYINIDAGLAFGVLPVTWLEVNANYNGKSIDVTWSTSTEINTSEFEVERQNSKGEFERIATIQAAGNSTTRKDYAIEDKNGVLEGGIKYYRIKQIDQDSRYTYSKVVSAVVPVENNAINIYPVPAVDKVTLSVLVKDDSELSVSVIDNKGAKVGKDIITQSVNKGHNLIELPLNGFVPGVYNVIITIDGIEYKKQLIVVE
jgi:hypothetical protein